MKKFHRQILVLAMVAACRAPHVPPAARDDHAQRATLARVSSSCSSTNPFNDPDPTDLTGLSLPDDVWRPSLAGTAVVIAERYLLTAAHLDSCPTIPRLSATLADGRSFSVVVERNDAMFGSGRDVARLEIATAEHFDLGIPPPVLAAALVGTRVCFATLHGEACGLVVSTAPLQVDAATEDGDSGAPLYDGDGALVGTATEGNGTATRAEPIGPYWLEGT